MDNTLTDTEIMRHYCALAGMFFTVFWFLGSEFLHTLKKKG